MHITMKQKIFRSDLTVWCWCHLISNGVLVNRIARITAGTTEHSFDSWNNSFSQQKYSKISIFDIGSEIYSSISDI